MKKIIFSLLISLFSLMSSAQYFSFPVNSISPIDGHEAIFVLESSDKMNSYSDRIYLDCQGFLAQLAFYNDDKNGLNGAPEELYDLDHGYCEQMALEIRDMLERTDQVCISLNIEQYELPKIAASACEVNI